MRRYAAAFALLVSLPLLAYAAWSATQVYRQQRDAVAAVQTAQADAAAARIQQFLRTIELQLAWLTALPWTEDGAPQRRLDALRALRQTPAIADIALIDGQGRERVAESRLELGRIDSMADRSASPAYSGAREARGAYYGDVRFHKGSEPFMTIAVAGPGDEAGVAIAEVSLKHIWDVVSPIRIGDEGIVYVVDPAGRLIAHPDINLVLQNTDLSRVLQVFEAQQRAGPGTPPAVPMAGTGGAPVLASSVVLAPPGWRVIIEQGLNEADALMWANVRGALWVAAASLLAALLAALWSAWRIARPVRALALGAERIGAGQLSHRIALHSGDELKQLGARFNAMAAELQASYDNLGQQVEERTRELSDANRAKSRLLAAASHDLRQPLHALNLMVAQWRLDPDAAERLRLGQRVEQAIASINALFDGLLDVSKLDAGVVRPQLAPFPIQRLLDRMDVAHSAAARAKGLELRIRPSDAWVASDAVLLERILGNLVGNAVRYTRSGAILVGCRHVHAGLRIAVWDTGIGIAPGQQARIFDEFYRLETEDSAFDGGLGLGLSIVARLAELLGHRVDVRSAPGRGSCFAVTVPLATRQMHPPAPMMEPRIDTLRGRRVLVIDNNDQVLESTARLLEGWGCRVRAEHGAPDDWSGQVDDVDLLLIDMCLNNGDDGVSAVSRLRRVIGRDVPALIMTGDVTLATRECITASGLPMLEKPVSALSLRSALTRLLQRD
ncbi:MAG: HAMP domain-containing protein [Comamonadaceae bacterium]|nr:HAMP domain-containing protein [Pseudomonadota bacterium]MDE2414381.1 HAMP domain-containing protein [Comamonadaceae bacterium]